MYVIVHKQTFVVHGLFDSVDQAVEYADRHSFIYRDWVVRYVVNDHPEEEEV